MSNGFVSCLGNITINPIEHASFFLWISVTGPTPRYFNIFVDPYDTGHGFYDNLPKADIILITHPHSDHFDLGAIAKIASPGYTLFVTPQDVANTLISTGLYPAETIIVMSNFESVTIYPNVLTIEAIPAYNFPPATFHPQGSWNGYILNLHLSGNPANDTRRIYVAGDTEDIPEMRALTNIDVAFLPMNLPYTMTVDTAADATIAFKPKFAYPYHYRTEDTTRYKALVESATDEVQVILYNWYPAGFDTDFFHKAGF